MIGKTPIGLQREKCREHYSAFVFVCIFIILAGNKDNHNNLDESITDLAALEVLKN